jgi:drug/metabolite transporter (DMT)-like permease
MELRVVIVWWIACLLWSGTFLSIRVGVEHVPPLTFAWLRLLIAIAVLVPISAARRGFNGVSRRDVVRVMCAGILLLGVNYGLLYWGARFIPSGLVAILQSSTPVLALALGWCLGSEIVTLRKVIALAAGVAGIFLIFRPQLHAAGTAGLLGSFAVLGSSLCVATAYVWLKRHGARVRPVTVTTLQCVAGLIPLSVAGLLIEGSPLQSPWTAEAVGALLYLALGASGLAFSLNYWLLQRMDASAMLMMGVAEVPIAVALGALLLGERLPPGALLGGACILTGVVLMLARADTELPRQASAAPP